MTSPAGGDKGFKIADGYVEVALDERGVGRSLDGIGRKIGGWAAGLGITAGVALGTGIAGSLNIGAANDKLAGQLGLTAQEAERAGTVAGQVYGANFGSSIEQVNTSIKALGGAMGDLGDIGDEELARLSKKALTVANTFDVDVNEATKAAGQLVKNGLAKDMDEAFDVVTKGFQGGLNASDDFLATLNEYSPYFKNLGVEGPEVLAILSRGLKAGARDTDYIADAFKEFNIRVIDGSKTTAEGFKAIGLNASTMGKEFAAGGDRAEKALQTTLQRLQQMKDPVAQNAAGVALFGTQWEDTMKQILPSMVNYQMAAEDVTGATDEMAETVGDNAAAKIETAKRSFEQWTQRLVESDGPIGDATAAVLGLGAENITAAGAVVSMGGAVAGLAKSVGSMALAVVRGTIVATGAILGMVAKGVAATVLFGGRMLWLGAQALIHGARIAAGWVLAMGPIGWLITAVVGLVALIVVKWNEISGFVAKIGRAIGGFFADMARAVAGGVMDAIRWIGSLPGRALSALGNLARTLWNKGKELIGGILTGIVDRFKDVVAWLVGLPGRVLSAIGDVARKLWQKGVDLVQGLIDGIESKFRDLIVTVGEMVGIIDAGVAEKLRIKSPSRVMAALGQQIPAGVAVGIREGSPRLRTAVDEMVGLVAFRPDPLGGTGAGARLRGGRAEVADRLEHGPYIIKLGERELASFVVDAVTGAPREVAGATDEGRRASRFLNSGRAKL